MKPGYFFPLYQKMHQRQKGNIEENGEEGHHQIHAVLRDFVHVGVHLSEFGLQKRRIAVYCVSYIVGIVSWVVVAKREVAHDREIGDAQNCGVNMGEEFHGDDRDCHEALDDDQFGTGAEVVNAVADAPA